MAAINVFNVYVYARFSFHCLYYIQAPYIYVSIKSTFTKPTQADCKVIGSLMGLCNPALPPIFSSYPALCYVHRSHSNFSRVPCLNIQGNGFYTYVIRFRHSLLKNCRWTFYKRGGYMPVAGKGLKTSNSSHYIYCRLRYDGYFAICLLTFNT